MKNLEIRCAAAAHGLRLWEVAERGLGISDSAFSRKLRSELPPEEKAKVLAAIDRIASEVS